MKLTRKNEIIILAAIIALGLFTRLVPYLPVIHQVATPIQTPDPHYHARRVIETVQHYPHLPVFDSYLSYPSGGYCIWPPAFDFLCATMIYGVFLGHPSIGQIEWGCALYPILYGLLIIFMVYYLGKALIDRRTALLGSLFAAILPSVVIWSRVGYIDHHVAESLVILLIACFLTRPRSDDAVSIIGLGVTMGLGMLMWQGVILFSGVAFVILLVRRYFKFFWSFGIALIMILPFCVKTHFPDSPFSYRGLSLLHIVLLLSASLVLLGLHFLRKKSRWSIAAGVALAGLIAILYFSPSFLRGFAFILKKDPWLANIIEFQPLMVQSGYWETITANTLYGRAYFVWPVLMALLYLDKRHSRITVLCALVLFTGLMAFLGRRYTGWFAPMYALILAYGFIRIWDFIGSLKKFALVKYPAMMALGLVIFQPVVQHGYKIHALSPRPDELAAFAWIRDHTPATSYFDDPVARPEYGIMCFWGDGHHLLYYSHRPVTASNFGNDVPNFRITNRYYLSEDEDEANAIMDSLKCRYVYFCSWQYYMRFAALYLNRRPSDYFDFYPVKDERGLITTIMMPTDKGYATTISRLQYYLGNSFYLRGVFFPPYRHYRLLYAGGYTNILKFYEYIPGAVIRSRSTPAAAGVIELDVQVMGEAFTYRDSLTADQNGVWLTTVPYPAGADAPYRLRINGVIKKVIVPRSALIDQDTISI